MSIKKSIKNFLMKYNKQKDFYYRILLFHDIEDMKKFYEIISFLSKNYNIVDYKKQNLQIKNNILISFDDGFKSNYQASKVLEEFDVRGVFFVNKSFILNERKQFSNIFRDHEEDISEKFHFMSVDDIKELDANGHTIGSHTLSHKNLARINQQEVINQIENNKTFLENLLNKKVETFAYPFGEITDINQNAIKIVSMYHPYIFSGVRGDNIDKKKVFYREPVNETNSISEIEAILHGCFDLGYHFKQKKLQNYAGVIDG